MSDRGRQTAREHQAWRAAWLAAAFALTLLTAGGAAAHGATVRVGFRSVTPTQSAVELGKSVHFQVEPGLLGTHTIVADDGSFRSPPLHAGEGWHHQFDAAGRLPYHVEEREDVRGELLVFEK